MDTFIFIGDYNRQIQSDNLQQIIGNNQTTLEAASGTTITLGALASAVKIEIVQTGTGTVTISGSNLNSRVASGAVILSAQYSGCTVYNNSGGTLANWVVVGDIAGT